MKLYDGKVQFLLIGTLNKLNKVNLNDIKIGNIPIKSAKKAKNLGVIWDNEGKLINYQESKY